MIKRDCLFFGCQIMEELYMKYRAVVMCVIVVCVIVVCGWLSEYLVLAIRFKKVKWFLWTHSSSLIMCACNIWYYEYLTFSYVLTFFLKACCPWINYCVICIVFILDCNILLVILLLTFLKSYWIIENSFLGGLIYL